MKGFEVLWVPVFFACAVYWKAGIDKQTTVVTQPWNTPTHTQRVRRYTFAQSVWDWPSRGCLQWNWSLYHSRSGRAGERSVGELGDIPGLCVYTVHRRECNVCRAYLSKMTKGRSNIMTLPRSEPTSPGDWELSRWLYYPDWEDGYKHPRRVVDGQVSTGPNQRLMTRYSLRDVLDQYTNLHKLQATRAVATTTTDCIPEFGFTPSSHQVSCWGKTLVKQPPPLSYIYLDTSVRGVKSGMIVDMGRAIWSST